MSVAEQGPTASILKGPVQLRDEFLCKDFRVGVFPRSLSEGGGGILDPNPSTRYIFGAPEEGVR